VFCSAASVREVVVLNGVAAGVVLLRYGMDVLPRERRVNTAISRTGSCVSVIRRAISTIP
jgi:hypothetical protein